MAQTTPRSEISSPLGQCIDSWLLCLHNWRRTKTSRSSCLKLVSSATIDVGHLLDDLAPISVLRIRKIGNCLTDLLFVNHQDLTKQI